jgi:hypothetical protein
MASGVEKLIKRKKVTELDQLIKDNIGKEPSSSRRREDLRKVGVESTENLNKVDIRLEDLTYPGKVSVKKRSSSSSASQSIKFESAKSADHSNSTGKDAETFNLPDLLIDNNESKREPNNEIIENLKQFNIDFKIKFEKEFKIENLNTNQTGNQIEVDPEEPDNGLNNNIVEEDNEADNEANNEGNNDGNNNQNSTDESEQEIEMAQIKTFAELLQLAATYATTENRRADIIITIHEEQLETFLTRVSQNGQIVW